MFDRRAGCVSFRVLGTLEVIHHRVTEHTEEATQSGLSTRYLLLKIKRSGISSPPAIVANGGKNSRCRNCHPKCRGEGVVGGRERMKEEG